MPEENKPVRITVTAYVSPEVARYLDRIAAAEFRSKSGAIGMLVLQEAARRGLVARAPSIVPASNNGNG